MAPCPTNHLIILAGYQVRRQEKIPFEAPSLMLLWSKVWGIYKVSTVIFRHLCLFATFVSFDPYDDCSLHRMTCDEKILSISSTMLSLLPNYHKKRTTICDIFPNSPLLHLPRQQQPRARFLYMTLSPHSFQVLTRLQVIARYQPRSALLTCHLRFPPSIILQPQNC